MGKTQEAVGGLTAMSQKGAHDYLNQLLLHNYGVADPLDKTGQTKLLPDYAKGVMLKYLPQTKKMEDVPGIIKQIEPELKTAKTVDLFNNPATGPGARGEMLVRYRREMQAAGRTPDPNVENFIKSQKVGPENLDWFQKNYQQAPASRPAAATSTAAAGEAPNLLDVATRLGLTFKHELSPPGTLGETILGPRTGAVPSLQKVAKRRVTERNRLWREEALPRRAEGGDVEKDEAYIVGENGPEVFVPEKKGFVLPDLSSLAPVRENKEDETALACKG